MPANPMANTSHSCQEMRDCTMGKRIENGLLNIKKKRAARRFYSSCQHPITNQFTLTTKLSKKRQRLGHSSSGLRRSQLSAQETAKKTPSISHITFLLKHDKEENIWQKRPKRGKPEINRI